MAGKEGVAGLLHALGFQFFLGNIKDLLMKQVDNLLVIFYLIVRFTILGINHVINADVQLCAAIALRWYKTTHTFHFPCGELGLTPLDFSMLTGISIGVGAYPPLPYDDGRWRDRALVHDLLPHLDVSATSYQAEGAIRVSAIRAAMDRILEHYSVDDDLELARLFVLYLMGNLFFSSSSSSVPVGFFAVAAEINADGAILYDWGTPILAYLYRCLDMQCTITDSQVSLFGFWELLQYWYFEYSRNFHFITRIADPSTFFPRICFWTADNRGPRDNESRHVFPVAHNQIELRMYRDQILWHPFEQSTSIDLEIIQIARMLAGRRFPLISCPVALGAYWYLGERCWRQLYDFDAIPDDPHPHTYRCMIYPTEQLDIARTAGWWTAESFVIIGECYLTFWRRFFTGSSDTITHAASIDLVGPSAI